MKTPKLSPERFPFLAVLIVLLIGCLVVPVAALADDPPPPPPPPSTPTFTPTPTDTPEPTDTPVPTDTPIPTDTPVPTATAKPTHTPRPVGPTGPQSTSVPNSDCQSDVTGSVTDASGGPALGATVLIEGADWSDAVLTNDSGQYGFNQLCPGQASLQAFFVDGQVSQLAELEINGRDDVQVQLSASAAEAAAISEPSATAEPEMPATGYTGWLLLGGAMLAVFLLLIAGTRRVMTVRERTGDRD